MYKNSWTTKKVAKGLGNIIKKHPFNSILVILSTAAGIILNMVSLLSFFYVDSIEDVISWLPWALPILYLMLVIILIYFIYKFFKLRQYFYFTFDFLQSSSRHRVIHLVKTEKDFFRKMGFMLKEEDKLFEFINEMYKSDLSITELKRKSIIYIQESILSKDKEFQKNMSTNSKIFLKDIFTDIESLIFEIFSCKLEFTLQLMTKTVSKYSRIKDLQYYDAFYEDKRESQKIKRKFPIDALMSSFVFKIADKNYNIRENNTQILVPIYMEIYDDLLDITTGDEDRKICIGFLKCNIDPDNRISDDDLLRVIIPLLIAKSETIGYYIKDCVSAINSFHTNAQSLINDIFQTFDLNDEDGILESEFDSFDVLFRNY